jgi:hypothetical protein
MLYVTDMKHIHLPYHTYVTSHCMHTYPHQHTASGKNKMIMARHGLQHTAVNRTHAFQLHYTCSLAESAHTYSYSGFAQKALLWATTPTSQLSTTTVVIADRMG